MTGADEIDREAEDVDFGQDNDLAADVDDGDVDAISDPEALDTDDEDDDDLGLNELSDSEYPVNNSL